MPLYCCDKCDYNTKIKRDICRHMNKKSVCRNRPIIITKEIANEILLMDGEDLFVENTTEEIEDLLKKYKNA